MGTILKDKKLKPTIASVREDRGDFKKETKKTRYMAILTVYTKLLDKTLEGARIIDMGSTKSCECFE